MNKRPTAVRRVFIFTLLSAAAAVFYHVDLLGRMAYAVERGRLRADREHVLETDAPEIAALEQVSNAFGLIAEFVKPSVVNIEAISFNRQLEEVFGREIPTKGTGSGVIIDEAGFIVTNNHVIEDARVIPVTLADGREFRGEVIGVDPQTDIAVIKIKADRLHAAKLGDSDRMKVGNLVLAIGSPFRLGHSVSHGIVSAIGRTDVSVDIDYQNWIQTDTPINPGNSGGPLINARGEIVGINTAIATETGRNEGVAFAIPSNTVRNVAEKLKSGRKIVRGYLGVAFKPIRPQDIEVYGLDRAGAMLVTEVGADSPAAKGGLKADDIILAVDGEPIDSDGKLQERIASKAPGTAVQLDVRRGKKDLALTVTLAEQPPGFSTSGSFRRLYEDPGTEEESTSNPDRAEPKRRGNDAPTDEKDEESSDTRRFEPLGFQASTLSPELSKRFKLDENTKYGVVITSVEILGNAHLTGLRRGDVIIRANDRRIRNVRQLAQELSEAALTKGVRIKLITRNGNNDVVLRMQ